ncbi:MAG: hypothetical protein ABSH51_00320 [Solirubrobacteraceae bacterium]|jgi:hypothetical protein
MSDRLHQNLRATLARRAAEVDPAASARLRAIDYHPRRHRVPALPALGALGASGAAAAAIAVVMLGSSAAPAFAGWSPIPTAPATGQLAAAEQACGANLGAPVLTDTRGPFTAAIYADATSSHTCLQGDSMSISSSDSGAGEADVPAGHVQMFGSGLQNSAGQALTLVDGRIGAGVTSVTIDRSDGSSVQATVSGGWYLAWWPGTTPATTAQVTTSAGTAAQTFPATPQGPGRAPCPAGAHCSSGYSFGAGREKSGSSASSGLVGTPQTTIGGATSQPTTGNTGTSQQQTTTGTGTSQ